MADKTTTISDLPLDILVLIFPYLDAKSFLALCSTCKGFQQPSIRLDSAYWSFATRSAFRVPNQPVVQHDGDRWEKMYRRLLTQSRVYTWGSNGHKRLGHGYDDPVMNRFLPRRPGRIRMHRDCSTPTEMEDTRELGIIADMQCGCVISSFIYVLSIVNTFQWLVDDTPHVQGLALHGRRPQWHASACFW
jgi:SCF-associated factor 1